MSEQTVPLVTFDDWARESGRIATEELRLGNPRAAKDFTDAALAFLALHNALEGDSTPINTDRDAAEYADRLDRIRWAVQPVADGAGHLGGISEVARFAKDILEIAGES